jgi:signal transduction histidine kinase
MKYKMMPFKTLLPASLMFAATLPAQDVRISTVDSLEQILSSSRMKKASLLPVYEALTLECVETNQEKAIHYCKEGIALAQLLSEWRTVGELYKNMGYAFYSTNRYDSALFYFEKILDVARLTPHDSDKDYLETKAWLHKGIVSDVRGRYHEAIDSYFKALNIAERNENKSERQKLYGNIGNVYFTMENDTQAEIYFTKGEQVCAEMNDSLSMYYHLLGLSNINCRRKNYEKALTQASLAYHIVRSHPALILDMFFVYQSLARIHDGMGESGKALECARESLRLAASMNNPANVCWALETISAVELNSGRYANAESAALRALEIDSSDMRTSIKLFEYLTKANVMLGRKDKAVSRLDTFIALIYQSANKTYHSSLSEMEVIYETEKKELKISALEEEKRLMLWLGVAGIAVLLLSSASLFFLWRWTVQKRRLAEQHIKQLERERRLIATQAVLDGETQERTRLARDLHDGLGGMLTSIKLNLENMKKDVILKQSDVSYFENALQILNESIFELRRVAHHLMPETLSRYGLKPAIGDFCRSLPSNIAFDWFGSETRFDPKLEVVVYRIVHELVNNALKYAEASQIMIQIMQEPDRIALTVQDDGAGFDPSAESQGMGLSNIRTRVASFGGNIQIDSVIGEGTEVNVELRIEN